MAAAAPIVLGGMALGNAVTGVINSGDANQIKQDASNAATKWDLQNSALALSQAKEDERRLRVQNQMQLGDMRAEYGASGVTTDGSPLEVMKQSARNAELDALTVRHAGALKAWGYINQAKMDQFDASASDRMQGGQVAQSLFGAGTQIASTYALKRT
jgi:hypothetical protein